MARDGKSATSSRARQEIQAGLQQMIRGLRRLGKEVLKHAGDGAPVKRKVSPGRRIHGQYIGLIRNLPAKDKAKVRAVRTKQGVEAAIKMAREMRQLK